MIETVEIKTLEDADKLLFDQQYNRNINRLRSDYLYRGMPDSRFSLTTSLERNCGELQRNLEPSILRYFTKYGMADGSGRSISVWEQMITGQHYGLPTRLLDWSHSSLIAMHFATAENEMEMTGKRDGIIWRIDVEEFTRLLPKEYQRVLGEEHTDFFSIASLGKVAPTAAKYDEDMGNHSMALIEPPSTDPRIINQYSYFSIVPLYMTDIEQFLEENTSLTVRYIIDKKVRWDLRDLLDQINISERIVFPGLDGLAKWVARHYYVRRDEDGGQA